MVYCIANKFIQNAKRLFSEIKGQNRSKYTTHELLAPGLSLLLILPGKWKWLSAMMNLQKYPLRK